MMNVFIRAIVRIFGERLIVPFNSVIASLNRTINLSPHENTFLTIALINIHYLYNVTNIICQYGGQHQ